jgi:hypothetical protein
LACVLAAEPVARACINGTVVPEQVHLLRRANAALGRGDYADARRLANVVLETADGDVVLIERGRWVIATSHVRDEQASRDELVAAVATMRQVKASRTPHDVTSTIDLAEALSRLPDGEDEARRLMAPLVRADLVGSAQAYAALARITNDPEERTRALVRCRTMAEDATICEGGFIASTERRDRWAARGLSVVLGLMALACLAAILAFALRARGRSSRLRAVVEAP